MIYGKMYNGTQGQARSARATLPGLVVGFCYIISVFSTTEQSTNQRQNNRD